jgi:hypothetical protein
MFAVGQKLPKRLTALLDRFIPLMAAEVRPKANFTRMSDSRVRVEPLDAMVDD